MAHYSVEFIGLPCDLKGLSLPALKRQLRKLFTPGPRTDEAVGAHMVGGMRLVIRAFISFNSISIRFINNDIVRI